MHGVPLHFDAPSDLAQFRQPAGRAGIELYRAHIVRHAFEPHTHEAFGCGAIESGAERFRYAGSEHVAPRDSIVLMNPDVLHTGRAATDGGWRYRMIYIDESALAAISGVPSWWFPRAVVDDDAVRARRVSRLLDALWQAREPLAFDSLLLQLLDELHVHARTSGATQARTAPRFARVIDYMRAHLAQAMRLEELAAIADLSPFHFLRSFRAHHHVTPQQMLMALRLYDAKQRLARGEAPARVAADSGLADQAHLTRAFQRRYGVTPARYQQQLRG